jgi:hypothetical protein
MSTITISVPNAEYRKGSFAYFYLMLSRIVLVLLISLASPAYGQTIYEIQTAELGFHSEAPKELISATSGEMKGLIDISKRTFAFKVDIPSFMGFNSPLQREHFNENYMESNAYPEASFSGKVIEDVDFSREGSYQVRAKGKLRIHGVERERIIKAIVTNKAGKLSISSDFLVALADHDIRIPRVVSEKLAPEISVSVKAFLKPVR